MWQRYIDPAFKDRAPKGYNRYLGDPEIEVEGQLLGGNPAGWGQAKAEEQTSIYQDPYENDWDAASQVRAMDVEGIDITALYPTRGLSVMGAQMDADLAAAIARGYNDWLYDFCSYAPDRMFGAAMLSPRDVESAISEARRSVEELGFKAIYMRPNLIDGLNWHDSHYDPLWAELERLGVPLGFHEGIYVTIPQVGERFETFMMRHTCCHPMEMMLAVVSFIGGGILERFPNLRVGFLEGNSAWAPWLVWRLNEHFELSGRYESPELKLEPTEYFKRQCYVSIEADEEPARFIEQTELVNNVVFSTDYPHNDAKYPHATERFLEMPISDEGKTQVPLG